MTELIVPRTCTEVSDESSGTAYSLECFRESTAYVLLGAPGAGKTEEFKREADLEGGCLVTARNFTTFDDKPEWHSTTLFVDGLDERRAGSSDQRTPLDQIRSKLYNLGCPKFRISCREADWFGASDQSSLDAVSSSSSVLVLRLNPLSDENIREILGSHPEIKDIDKFLASARQRGFDGLLRNPQSLKMLAKAVTGERWPESRMATFDSACQLLVRETNTEHLQAKPDRTNESDLLNARGIFVPYSYCRGMPITALTRQVPEQTRFLSRQYPSQASASYAKSRARGFSTLNTTSPSRATARSQSSSERNTWLPALVKGFPQDGCFPS